MSDSCDPIDCSPLGSPIHRISQARILKWVAISFSRASSWLRDWTWVSCIAGGFFTDSTGHTRIYSLNCLETSQTKGLLLSSFYRWEHWGLNYSRHHPRSKPGFSSTKAIPNHDIIIPINSTCQTHFLRIVFLKKIIVSLLFHSNKFWGEQ